MCEVLRFRPRINISGDLLLSEENTALQVIAKIVFLQHIGRDSFADQFGDYSLTTLRAQAESNGISFDDVSHYETI